MVSDTLTTGLVRPQPEALVFYIDFLLPIFQAQAPCLLSHSLVSFSRPETMTWATISPMSSSEQAGILQGLENQDGETEEQKVTREEDVEVGR